MTLKIIKDFFSAIENGDVDAVRKLIAKDPSLVNQPDEVGYAPLMRAVSSVDRTPELVQTIIEAGADVNSATSEGYTSLHIMIDVNGPTGYGEMPGLIARLLVNAGADVEARQHWGWTPLMRAVIEGTTDELQAIVDVGASVNVFFPEHTLPAFARGHTLLMAAVGNPKKVEILIKAGVDVCAVDANGQTALEYARKLLAESEGGKTEKKQCVGEIDEAALKSALEGMKKAGIDPDAPMPYDEDGLTYRQAMERSMRQLLKKAAEFDFSGEVRKSVAIIEKVIGGG